MSLLLSLTHIINNITFTFIPKICFSQALPIAPIPLFFFSPQAVILNFINHFENGDLSQITHFSTVAVNLPLGC